MKKKMVFQCQECGHQYPRWMGKCSQCGSWNTFIEVEKEVPGKRGTAKPAAGGVARLYGEIDFSQEDRIKTGFSELDRVLGEGLVKGSVVLIGGSPGVGKSTLLLQVAGCLSRDYPLLYVTGEESARQIKMRGNRLGIQGPRLYVAAETNFEVIRGLLESLKPGIVIIDSIQTVYRPEVSSTPGTASQVREVTAEVMQLAKREAISFFLVGHVTKDGIIAGPRLLEHMVDCVLYFEGDPRQHFLLLRGVKNRFGSTNELGVFHMQDRGVVEITNPSEAFLSPGQDSSVGSAVVANLEGSRPLLVEVQALVTPSHYPTSRRMTAGLDSNRVALLMAVLEKRMGLYLHDQDAYLNVAGGVKLSEPAIDLGVAVALVSSFKNRPVSSRTLFTGEVGLTGEVRAVNSLEKRVAEGKKLGFDRFIVPSGSLESLGKRIPGGVEGVGNLEEALCLVFP